MLYIFILSDKNLLVADQAGDYSFDDGRDDPEEDEHEGAVKQSELNCRLNGIQSWTDIFGVQCSIKLY